MKKNSDEYFTTNSNNALDIADAIAVNDPIDPTTTSLILKLQSSLSIKQVIQTFSNSVQDNLQIEGLEYDYPLLDLSISIGNKANRSYGYLIEIEGESLGKLVVSRKDDFTKEQKNQMDKFISTIIFPLKNAVQHECALIQAANDSFLGMPNWNHLESQLTREAKLAIRTKQTLCLLLIDIDRFTTLRERHGSHFGDIIIRHVYEQIQKCIRDTDILYRFGSDQFALILSNIQEFNATQIAERVRVTIQDQELENGDGKRIKLTVSIGISELQLEDSIEHIYNRAFTALKHAKNSGRNQVKVAESNFKS